MSAEDISPKSGASIPPCPLCGHDTFSPENEWELDEGKKGSSTYYHCPFCDLISLDPRFHPSLESERERYLEHNNSPHDCGYTRYLRSFAEEALFPFVSSPSRVLDYGSGPTPVFAELLRSLDYSVSIYDPIFAPDFFSSHSFEEIKGNFDAITAIEVAEHFFSPGKEFSTLASLLRPGGYLSVRTLLHYSDKSRFADWWYRRDRTHVCFYSRRSFEVLAELFGLELVSIKKNRSVILQKPARGKLFDPS